MNDAQKHLVFVVEDDEEVRISTRALLEAWGYAVREFASGEEVITANDAGTAGCIVLDHNLSGMTGLELIRQLRADGLDLRHHGRRNASSLSPPPTAARAAVLRKPLSAEALEQWLEQIFLVKVKLQLAARRHRR